MRAILCILFVLAALVYTHIQSAANGIQRSKQAYPLAGAGDYGIEMLRIPAGKFTMGSPNTEKDRGGDEVEHEVVLSEYYISKYEVTVGQFKMFIEDAGYNTDAEQKNDKQNWRHGSGGNLRDSTEFNHPVIN
ncbi:MAG: SUMF1/EgtB/PvdO family nonheme iron enzyme, partial [Cytophagales bacterium]|nr:SUMF1/EgtB/PvdO family nonheme iron enzyme [Cytophaga sp.]